MHDKVTHIPSIEGLQHDYSVLQFLANIYMQCAVTLDVHPRVLKYSWGLKIKHTSRTKFIELGNDLVALTA